MIQRTIAWLLSGVLIAPLCLLVLLSLTRHWTWPALLPTEWQTQQWRAPQRRFPSPGNEAR